MSSCMQQKRWEQLAHNGGSCSKHAYHGCINWILSGGTSNLSVVRFTRGKAAGLLRLKSDEGISTTCSPEQLVAPPSQSIHVLYCFWGCGWCDSLKSVFYDVKVQP